ncbi:MAG: formylglycine-generating enzyme family protein, partial [Panacagrimonas sp.]
MQKATLDCPEPPPFTAGATGTFHFRDCADSPDLVRLMGGKFQMGESGTIGTLYERPLREVTVGEFSIGKYEITFDEWDACYREKGCLTHADDEGWGRGRRPVINISWVDAQQYVHWLSEKTGHKYRLPTEAEWEYAARAGTEGRYFWGEGAEWACESANVFDLTGWQQHQNWHWRATCDDRFSTTAPV